ncbi:DUF11 domain-containing protein [bacterium]|nr:DUF11 domain-containing protein [bacterium]
MKAVMSVIVFSLFLSVSTCVFAQAPVLKGDMEARKIVIDEKNNEVDVPADKVVPNDVVEYTLRYRNTGEASASGVELVGPVPPGTVYMEKSVSNDRDIAALFSIDGGKSYHSAPVTYFFVNKDGKKEERKATLDMITHIKWKMSEDLEASGIVTTSYRVQVK